MAVETQTSRDALLIEKAIEEYAEENQWSRGDYGIDIIPNEEWGSYLVVVKSTRFESVEEVAVNKEIYGYLRNALAHFPSLFNAIDLDVISLRDRRGFLTDSADSSTITSTDNR